MAQLNVYKVTSLPGSPNPDSIYLVKGILDTEVSMFVTDNAGTARPLSSAPTELRTAGDTGIGAIRYSGTTRTSGQLYGGTTPPVSTTRLNYDGEFLAKILSGNVNSNYSSDLSTVSTTAIQVSPISTFDGALHLVNGVSGSNKFTQLILQGSNGIVVISTHTEGSPANRNYSISGGRLSLSMSSGTYNVTVSTIANILGIS